MIVRLNAYPLESEPLQSDGLQYTGYYSSSQIFVEIVQGFVDEFRVGTSCPE